MDMVKPSEMVSRLDLVVLELTQLELFFVGSPRVSGILEYLWSEEAVERGTEGANTPRARLGLLVRPGGCCPPRAASPVLLWTLGCLLAQKKSTKSFAAFGLRLIWIFYKTKTGQKTVTGTWHYVNRLVSKN